MLPAPESVQISLQYDLDELLLVHEAVAVQIRLQQHVVELLGVEGHARVLARLLQVVQRDFAAFVWNPNLTKKNA